MTTATLSLTVDSTKVTSAHAELDRLTAAAQRSTKAVNDLVAPAAKAGTAAALLEKQTGLARHELINLSRQAQDVGVSLLSGQSPFLVLVQQGTQIADVFGSSQGTLRGFTSQVASALTPTRLLAGGIGLAAAAAGTLAAWTVSSERALANLSERAGTTTATMRALRTEAEMKGLSRDDFAAGMEKFAEQTLLARAGLGNLAQELRAGGYSAGTLEQNLLHAATQIANAKDEADKYRIAQAYGIPPTREWVKFLGQGADAIQRAAAEAKRFSEGDAANIVGRSRDAETAWNRFWTGFKESANDAGVIGLGAVAKIFNAADQRSKGGVGYNTPSQWRQATPLMNQGEADAFSAALLPKGGRSPSGPASETSDELTRKNNLIVQRISALGQLATVQDTLAAKTAELNLLGLNDVRLTGQQRDAVLAYTRAQANGTLQIRASTDAQSIEAAAVGMATGAAAAYRAEQELLADFRRRGITLEEQDTRAIRETTKALGEATQAAALRRMQSDIRFDRSMLGLSDAEQQVAQKMRTLYGDNWQSQMQSFEAQQLRVNASLLEAKNNAQAFASGFVNDIMNGTTAVDALSNALKRLGSSLIDKGLNSFLSSAFGTTAISSGNVFGTASGSVGVAHTGGVVGHDAFAQRMASPSWFAGADRFSAGGIAGLGPDEVPIIAHRDEEIIRADDPRHRNNGGGGVSFAMPVTINATGNAGSDTAVAVRVALTQFAQMELYPHVVRVVRDAKSRGHID